MPIEIQEQIDYNKLRFLQDTYTLEMFKNSKFVNFKTDKSAQDEFKKIMDYVDFKLKKNDNIVEYDFATRRFDGRLIGTKSIQNIKKNVRSFLSDHTIDIDIRNAHPCILWNICRKYDITCPYLEKYVLNRDEVLNSIQTSDDVNYETAKKTILIITNSKLVASYKTHNDFVNGYIKEIRAIHKKLLEIPKYDYLKDIARFEKGNFEGSFTNHILCVHENEILNHLIKYFTDNNFKIFALMFDGLMIYKSENKIDLSFAEEYIASEMNYENIRLVIKNHTTDIIMPEDYSPYEKPDYEKCKENFEKNCCKVDSHFYCCDKMYKREGFKTRFEDLFYYERGIAKPFIGRWFADPDKRSYDYEDTYPKDSDCPKNCYNLWKPWAALDVNLTDVGINLEYINSGIDFFFNHIKILCGNQENVYNFVVWWLAQMFQYPEIKTVELIFISNEGAGKGLFEEFLKGIMGSDKVVTTADPQRDIFGSFNELLKDSVLIIFNEANKANFYQQNDKKKALITDRTQLISRKHLPAITIKSLARCLTFTNNPDPANKNKRRDIFIRCSDEKINCDEYFSRGWEFAQDKYVVRGIYDRLIGMQIKKNISAVDIPTTAYDDFIKEVQKNPIIRFLEYYAGTKTGTFVESSNSLYEQYVSYTSENHIPFSSSDIQFKAAIKKENLKGCEIFTQKTRGNPLAYNINCELLRVELRL